MFHDVNSVWNNEYYAFRFLKFLFSIPIYLLGENLLSKIIIKLIGVHLNSRWYFMTALVLYLKWNIYNIMTFWYAPVYILFNEKIKII